MNQSYKLLSYTSNIALSEVEESQRIYTEVCDEGYRRRTAPCGPCHTHPLFSAWHLTRRTGSLPLRASPTGPAAYHSAPVRSPTQVSVSNLQLFDITWKDRMTENPPCRYKRYKHNINYMNCIYQFYDCYLQQMKCSTPTESVPHINYTTYFQR